MMLVLTVAVSRLVPLLFLYSIFLVAGRYLHDRYSPKSGRLGAALFASVLVLGAIVAAPGMMRAFAVVMAETYYHLSDWERADRFFTLHAQLGGKCGDVLTSDWAGALMNQRKWSEAEDVILTGMTLKDRHVLAHTEDVLQLGICRYYGGRLESAERTFRALPARMPLNHLKHYFLGRLAESRGDALEALAQYEAAMDASRDFFPAVYQYARLCILEGRRDAAAEALRGLPRRSNTMAGHLLAACEAAIRGGPVPEQTEFMIVQIDQ